MKKIKPSAQLQARIARGVEKVSRLAGQRADQQARARLAFENQGPRPVAERPAPKPAKPSRKREGLMETKALRAAAGMI